MFKLCSLQINEWSDYIYIYYSNSWLKEKGMFGIFFSEYMLFKLKKTEGISGICRGIRVLCVWPWLVWVNHSHSSQACNSLSWSNSLWFPAAIQKMQQKVHVTVCYQFGISHPTITRYIDITTEIKNKKLKEGNEMTTMR